MFTAYLDHLQHASAGAQIAGCLLGSLAIGLGPFAVANLIQHIRANVALSRAGR